MLVTDIAFGKISRGCRLCEA